MGTGPSGHGRCERSFDVAKEPGPGQHLVGTPGAGLPEQRLIDMRAEPDDACLGGGSADRRDVGTEAGEVDDDHLRTRAFRSVGDEPDADNRCAQS